MTKLNKRVLSALLAVILLLTNFPVVSAASDSFAIYYEGETVTEVEFYEHERITVSAEGIPGGTHQWQIQIPGTEQWVNIQGQTSQTINLSKAVVGSLMMNGSAYVRCAAISDGEEIDHTAALRTTVKKEEPAPQISAPPVVTAPAAKPTPAPTEPPVEATEAPTEPVVETEPVPEITEPTESVEVPAESIEQTEPDAQPEVTAPAEEPAVEATESPVEKAETPVEVEEIPAETAAPAKPEAEVVVTAPVEEPAVEATESSVEKAEPTESVEIPAETAAPAKPEAEVVATAPVEAPVVEATETPVEKPQTPVVVEEIPAETTAPAKPEAEVVATAPAEEPVVEATEAPAVTEAPAEIPTEPAEEKPAETFIEKVVQMLAPKANADEGSDTEIVTITIHYRAVDRDGKFETTQEDATSIENAANAEPVVDPYVANIISGSNLNVTVPCRVVPGYMLVVPSYHENTEIAVSGNNLELNLSGVSKDMTFYVYYKEVMVSYSARYFIQNVYNDLYTEDPNVLTENIKQNMKGYPGDEPDTSVIYPDITGFTALFFQPDTIASDGSTIFEVYYDRNYYLMNFNMDGGYGTAPVYARYGTAFSVANPTKPGHSFVRWEETYRDINTDNSAVEDPEYVAELKAHMQTIPLTASGCVTKVPFSNLTYKASWATEEAPYSVAYWIQGDDGKTTYLGSTIRYAPSETPVSGGNDLTADTPLCNATSHTHGNDCMSCKHLHTNSCYGYLNYNQNVPDATRLAAIKSLGKGEPEIGYIYAVDYPEIGWTWYNLYFGGTWHCWWKYTGAVELMVSGSPLKTTTYTDSNSNTHEVRKYHAKWENCSHVHNEDCVKTCTMDEHVHGTGCFYKTQYMEFVSADTNVKVKGDGSSVVNVYYRYKAYTLIFYYARTTGGTDTNGDGVPDSNFTRVEIPGGSTRPFGYQGGDDMPGGSYNTADDAILLQKVGSWGKITGTALPSLKNNQNVYQKSALKVGNYYYHYVKFTARYKDNISGKWPCDVFNSVERDDNLNNGYNDEWTSKTAVVSAWNPETRVKYVWDNQNSTIKGKYELMDENLLFDPRFNEDASEISFLCFWENGAAGVKWNIPELYRYNIYLEALPGQDLTGKVVITKVDGDGTEKTYVRAKQYNTCDDSSVEQQTQPAMTGFTSKYYGASSRTYSGTEINEDNRLEVSHANTGLTDKNGNSIVFEYRTLTAGTDYDTSVYNEGSDMYFYYTRNGPYTLNFWNHSDYMVDGEGEKFYWDAPLEKFKASDNNVFMTQGYTDPNTGTKYGPYYPKSLEPKAYTFGGWYTTAEFIAGTKVNWDTMKMPDSNLTVYAKWDPVSYDTYFYMDYARYEAGVEFFKTEDTLHGSNITADLSTIRNLKFKDANGTINDEYLFVNWFYIDTDGTKKAFNPSEMAIRKELHLFAEWTSTAVKEYTVSYQQGKMEGTEIVAVTPAFTMADSSGGYALEATTKTFTALPKDKLTNFPDGTKNQLWLPHTNSHSIVMRSDNRENVFTFYYVTKDEVKYTVRYLDSATNEPVSAEEEHTVDVAVVTERFKYVEDYIPDAFHKRLVLSADEAENVIIFYYTKDDDIDAGGTGSGGSGGGGDDGDEPGEGRARYLVVHHFPELDGSDYLIEEDSIGDIGERATVTEQERPGFKFDVEITKTEYNKRFDGNTAEQNVTQSTVNGKWNVSGTITSGEDDEKNKPLELHLYYKRETFGYTIVHKDRETSEMIKTETVGIKEGDEDKQVPFETVVSVKSEGIKGYDLYAADVDGTKTLTLKISWEEDLNVITFYYIKKKVKIEYVPVCTDTALTSGFGGVSQPVELDKTQISISGSEASAASGFNFLGWYKDKNPTDENLITKNVHIQSNDINLITDVYDYTYYAIFEPITLTISQTNMKPSDSAVYEVVQGDDVIARVMLTGESDSVTLQAIPAGNYTVREVTDNWTWTYTDTQTASVTVVAGQTNTVTFDYEEKYEGSCWLHSENHR